MNLTTMCDLLMMELHLKLGWCNNIWRLGLCLDKLLQCDHGRDVVIKVGLFNDNFHTQLSIPYNGSKHKTPLHTKVYGEFLEFRLIFLWITSVYLNVGHGCRRFL
jgi:hypothetical protein